MTIKSKCGKISYIEQHDYLTLKMPNGNFTINRHGIKVTGNLLLYPEYINNIEEYIKGQKDKRMTNGQAFESLLDSKVLSKLYPKWDMVEDAAFVKNDKVRIKDKFSNKRFNGNAIVEQVKKTSVDIIMDNGDKLNVPIMVIEKI